MVSIRAGAPTDIEMCARLWVRAVEDRDGHVDAEARATRVHSAFTNPVLRFAVATDPAAGFALTEFGKPDSADALLHFLAVAPSGKGLGVGSALIRDAVDHAAAAGFTSLILETGADHTRAIGIYERAGFVACGAPVPHPVSGEPMQLFRLRLGAVSGHPRTCGPQNPLKPTEYSAGGNGIEG